MVYGTYNWGASHCRPSVTLRGYIVPEYFRFPGVLRRQPSLGFTVNSADLGESGGAWWGPLN